MNPRITKKTKGITMLEMIITIGILTLVLGMVGMTMVIMFRDISNRQGLDELHMHEQDVRLALLSIVRDARLSHGFYVFPPDSTPQNFERLELTTDSDDDTGFDIVYQLDGGGVLRRIVAPRGTYTGTWDERFVPVELSGFFVERYPAGGNQMRIVLESQQPERLEDPVRFETRVTVGRYRIPQ